MIAKFFFNEQKKKRGVAVLRKKKNWVNAMAAYRMECVEKRKNFCVGKINCEM